MHERDARVLAGEGFIVLALAYFGSSGLPPGLIDIPLEYFFRGLDVLASQPRAGDGFGVLGGSRGGEAALLVATHDQRVKAAVSVVGSGLVTEGIDFRRGGLLEILDSGTNSWTRRGEPIPYLPYRVSDTLRTRVCTGRPVRLASVFPPVPTDAAYLEQVSIPIERTNAQVLLLSSEDDGNWPSAAYSQVAADRLRAHGRPVEHRVFAGAGHHIAGPPGRTITTTTSPGPGVVFEMGGEAGPTSRARDDAWAATVAFLRDHLL